MLAAAVYLEEVHTHLQQKAAPRQKVTGLLLAHLVTNFAPPCCNRRQLAELQRVFFLLLQGQHALLLDLFPRQKVLRLSPHLQSLHAASHWSHKKNNLNFLLFAQAKSPAGLSFPADLPHPAGLSHPDALPHSGSLPPGALKHFSVRLFLEKSLVGLSRLLPVYCFEGRSVFES